MFTTRPELQGTFGMIATTHWLATAAGMGVLERGGNAFDAAVAAGFVLQVVEPHMNGPGGEVPILLWEAESDTAHCICGQGVAPEAATPEHFATLGLDIVPGNGLLPAVVPGAFDAWLTLLRDHGTWSLADVLAPALGYAEAGHPLLGRVVDTIAGVQALFAQEWRSSAALWLPHGRPPPAGRLFANRVLARTWRRLLAEAAAVGGGRERQIDGARRAFYQGFVAEEIDRFCRGEPYLDTSGDGHAGLLTGQDMAAWRASREAPLTYDYGGVTVCKTGPWGQGPVFLQQLAILKHFDIAAMDTTGPDFVHLVVEAAKLALADREAFYGDPDFVDVPVVALLSDAYNRERAALIGGTASAELRPGRPDGRSPWLPDTRPQGTRAPFALLEPTRAQAQAAGEPTRAQQKAGEPRLSDLGTPTGDTCHIDVVDADGNMVSATPSGGWLQSSPTIPALGFALSNRGQMFWLDPRSPSVIGPKRRPRTTLTPTLVLRDGRGAVALGTPGGDQQDQWSLLLFLRTLHHRLNLQEAIDAPAFHTDHAPSSFWPRPALPASLAAESRFPEATLAELARRGHKVEANGPWSLGRLSAVSREETPEGAILKAGANPRFQQGYAAGR